MENLFRDLINRRVKTPRNPRTLQRLFCGLKFVLVAKHKNTNGF